MAESQRIPGDAGPPVLCSTMRWLLARWPAVVAAAQRGATTADIAATYGLTVREVLQIRREARV
jgi:hypothetical protein